MKLSMDKIRKGAPKGATHYNIRNNYYYSIDFTAGTFFVYSRALREYYDASWRLKDGWLDRQGTRVIEIRTLEEIMDEYLEENT